MKIEVGKGYRRLRANEILREGDKWYNRATREWTATILAGHIALEKGIYRRRVATKASGNGRAGR